MIRSNYTTRQVAALLSANSRKPVSVIRVIRWCNAGRFPGAYLSGGRWRIPTPAIVQFRAPRLGRPRGARSKEPRNG